jgi:phosphopantothenoylcysteine decarboxylase / phosphopantothenate---cysteine ligase
MPGRTQDPRPRALRGPAPSGLGERVNFAAQAFLLLHDRRLMNEHSPAVDKAPSLTRVVLGVTGGIAAYKAAELARLFVKAGIAVDVVMTAAAMHFVTATTFQALSGRPVRTDLWESGADDAMGHIALSRGADCIVVAPASADFLAKLAHGHADDLLTTLCVARECPLFVAPAMNRQMWANAATQRNVALLAGDGVGILGPDTGELACKENGDGRMLEAVDILALLVAAKQPKVLAGVRVLLTAGPTFEAIDPVRGITNSSSGKMGFALAQAAAEAGAVVTVVAGRTEIATPNGVVRVPVTSAAEMAEAVLSRVDACDVFIGVAAVADYTPATPSVQKVKKSEAALSLVLTPTVDILATVAARPKAPFCVGFAAESQDVERLAEEKRRRKKLPLLVANRAQDALGRDDNEVTLLDDAGAHPLPRMDKLALARRLVTEIARRLPSPR